MSLLAQNGFDPIQHERIQAELRAGHIGLAQNRIPASIQIDDVAPEDLFDARQEVGRAVPIAWERTHSLPDAVAVVTLSGGAGSRWTRGAGVVKALSPFCRLAERIARFSRCIWQRAGAPAVFLDVRCPMSSPPAI